MQTLLWQKLRFLKFINSFFNPFWRKRKSERLKEGKDVKKVLPINEALFRPFAWKERPLLLYYFSSFTAYLFTPSPLTPFFFPTSSFLLPSILLTSYYFSPSSFPPYHLLLTTSLLTPYYFSPYSFPAFSSNLSTSHCSCWAMVSCPLSSSMASSALRNGLTSRWLSL